MGCMRLLSEEDGQCPNCALNRNAVQAEAYLPLRTTLGGKYLVGMLKDHNGDGASYMGWDIASQSPVIIREYFPDSICARSDNSHDIIVQKGKEEIYLNLMTEFIRLWSHLLDISGSSAMIDVYDILEENNTVYAIHEYADGITLREFLLRTPTGYVSWDKARSLLMPVLSSLENLHAAGIIHRGISPVTLIFDSNGKLRLTGFSIAEARTMRSPLNSQLFPGYSAIEQYGMESQQGPWTDVYAFAAVLYRTLIGSDPIDSKSRVANDRLMIPGKFAEQLPAFVINGLINALQILPENRTKTAERCRDELSAAPNATVSLEDDTLFTRQPSYAGKKYEAADDIDDSVTVIADGESFRPAQNGGYGNESFAEAAEENRYPDGEYAGNANRKKGSSVVSQVLIGALGVLIAVALLLIVLVKLNIVHFSSPEGETTAVSYEYVEVPNFEGRSFETIKNTPEFNAHFVFAATYEYSDKVEEGYIISQDVIAYSKVKNGTVVNLVISKGIEQIELTNVEGMSYDEAVKLLSGIGFEVEMDTRKMENDGTHNANTVYKMSPSTTTGKTYDKGTKIVLTVWAEKVTTTAAPIVIPDVTVIEDEVTEAIADNAEQAEIN